MHPIELRLENFKIFKEAHIKFRPLTLLTGTNSSGKSTVLHALAAILQMYPGRSFPFEFVSSGRNCALGSYKNIVHGGNTRTRFGIELWLHHEGDTVVLRGRYRYAPSGNQILPD